jgi:hypothetical protein
MGLKGTRDFQPSFFSHQKYPPWTLIHILIFFIFSFKFVDFFQLRFVSLLHHAAGSKILLLHNAAGSQIVPLHHAAGSQVLPLHDAAGSKILPPHDASGSQFGSGESNLKTLEESLGP